MAFGARTFGLASNIQLDTSDGVITVLGIRSFNIVYPSSISGSFTDANLAKGTPFYFLLTIPHENYYGTGLISPVTFSGTTCNWKVKPSIYGDDNDQSGTLSFMYGYF